MTTTINFSERVYYLSNTLGNFVFCNLSDLSESFKEMTTFKPPFIYEFTASQKFKRCNKYDIIERLENSNLDSSFLAD